MFTLKQIRNISASILTIWILLPTLATGEPLLIFGGVSNIPPLSFEQDGAIVGFLPDVFREIAANSEVEINIKLFPFKRLNIALEDGKVDGVISIFYKKSREAYLLYSEHPVLVSRYRIFVKKGHAFQFDTIPDLYGKRIGVLAGWSVNNKAYEQAVENGTIIVEGVPTYSQNFNKLMLGRLDCVVLSEQLGWYHAVQLGFNDNIELLDRSLSEISTYYAVSKNSYNIKDPKRLIKKLDAALTEMNRNGGFVKIQKRYGIRDIK